MATRQALVVVGVVVMATLAVVVPTVSAGALAGDGVLGPPNDAADGLAQTETDLANETEEGSNGTTFGTQMAAFMQSNAAQVNDSIEDGMWEAAFERANESERARMVKNRAESLEGRMNALAAQNHSLYQQYRNGSLSYEEYVVQASQLNGRMEALEGGIDGTARAAERAGLNESSLEELRTNARNLTGPDVAGVARGLIDGDTGPPEGVPGREPAANGTDRPGNGPQADRSGGPDGQSGDGTPAGQSGDPTAAGNGDRPADPANQSTRTPGGGSGNQSGGQGSNGADDGTDPPGAGPGNSAGEGPSDGNGDGGSDAGPGDGPAAGNGDSGNSSGGSGSNDNGPPEAPGASDGDGNDDDNANDGNADDNANDGNADDSANDRNGDSGNDNANDGNGDAGDETAGNGAPGGSPPGRIAGTILLTIWP